MFRHLYVVGLLLCLLALEVNALGANEHSPGASAKADLLDLNIKKGPIYAKALRDFQEKLLQKSPVIVALFSSGGGKAVLFRPGQEPLQAPEPPVIYQLAKSVGHAGIALYAILTPYADAPELVTWKAQLQEFRDAVLKAIANLDVLEAKVEDRDVFREVLTMNLNFADEILQRGTYTADDVQRFARSLKPLIKKLSAIAGGVQVNHWVDVFLDWKKTLGNDWEKTYAVTNTLYVTRQNNILFSILAQFMGQDAINQRLLLLETSSFTSTPKEMLDLLTRILNDRDLSQAFFNDYMLMDSELLGSAARAALKDAMERKGLPSFFPEFAHFNSNEWPWRTNPNYGSGPRTLEETLE